jgi:hypothetical protein
MRLDKRRDLLDLLENFRHDASPGPFLLGTTPRSQSLREMTKRSSAFTVLRASVRVQRATLVSI